jgi:hypothetical protein
MAKKKTTKKAANLGSAERVGPMEPIGAIPEADVREGQERVRAGESPAAVAAELAARQLKAVSLSVSLPHDLNAGVQELRTTLTPGIELGVSQAITYLVRLGLAAHKAKTGGVA